MRIHEVCVQCALTRKAVEYYEKQGLVRPAADENGYRNYSADDARRLAEISALRRLGAGIPDIKAILDGPDRGSALAAFRLKLEQSAREANAALECLAYLCDNPEDIVGVSERIRQKLDGGASIADRLALAFPGAFGKLLCCHFGRFLGSTLDSDEKSAAYMKIIHFLDSLADMEFPGELVAFLDEALGKGDDGIQKIDDTLLAGVSDFEGFMRANREAVERYLEYRTSEEYLCSPAHQMKKLLSAFFNDSGYYDVFIPNMKVLSDSYREYMEKMEAANTQLLHEYSEIGDLFTR